MTKAEYRAAKAKIADEAHWTTGVFARNLAGASVLPDNPNAVRYCAFGACEAVIPSTWDTIELIRAAKELFSMPVTGVNDRLGHAAVMQMFDRAIELANEE